MCEIATTFTKSRNDGGYNSNSLLWVLFLNHTTNISRQKYILQAQCLYGEFEGLLYNGYSVQTRSAPQLKKQLLLGVWGYSPK